MTFPSVRDIQQDWRLLDRQVLELCAGVRLISHEKFTPCCEIDVEYVSPGPVARFAARCSQKLFHFFYAWQLLRECSATTVLILNGGSGLWLFVGFFNRFFYRRKRRVLCWDVFVEVAPGWKQVIMSTAMKGMTLLVLWSRAQIVPHARFLGIPEERFVFLPFKANHSKGPQYDIPIGNFIFSGGNGKRDYRCLIDAVRDTGIPVVISATDPNVRQQIELLPTVIVLGAPEPGFAQLQAASRFVVIPMIHTGLKGGGEANFCNAMWHGKPVIVADNIAASDYILEGETGYIVPSGDSCALRWRILELWNDPAEVSRIGAAARKHVAQNFTHVQFIRRLLGLALVLGADSSP